MSKVRHSLLDKDMHKSYAIRMSRISRKPMELKEYRKFLKVMGKVLADEILQHGIVQLPWGLGDVYLKNRQYWQEGGTTGAVYVHAFKRVIFNDHTDGWIKKFFWLSPERKDKKSRKWCFSANRHLKRDLAKILLTENRQYPDFDKMLKML